MAPIVLEAIIISPLLETLANTRRRTCESVKKCYRAIQTTPPNEELRILPCLYAEENAHGILSLLEASNPSTESPIRAFIVLLIELLGRDAPVLISHKETKENELSHIMAAFEIYSQSSHGLVSLEPFTMVAPIKYMDEMICKLASDEQIPLIIVPFHKSQVFGARDVNAFHHLCEKIQEFAPSTVGVLVDNFSYRSRLGLSPGFSYNAGVVFIGGADDREALAYGIRMADHPKVNITVLRLRIKFPQDEDEQENDENRMEKKLDEELVDEFKEKLSYRASIYREEFVHDAVHVIDTIKSSFQSDLDLLMVGRRHSISKRLFDEEMAPWVENSELGPLGDFLASQDFCGGSISVLVMRHVEDGGGTDVLRTVARKGLENGRPPGRTLSQLLHSCSGC